MEDLYYDKITDGSFLSAAKRRRSEADEYAGKYGLEKVREDGMKQYLGTYVKDKLIDDRYQDTYNDNRQFTSVRTIVPFLTARVTAPEVTPANGDDLSMQFAEDFEEALQKHAHKQKARGKIRLAIQDLLKGQRVGVLKWRYDKSKNNVVLEHVNPKSIKIGKRAKLFEEPDYVGHEIEKSVGDLLAMFPDKEEKILQVFGIERKTASQLDKVYNIMEEWLWVDGGDGKELVVGWSFRDTCFGKINDPNWDEDGNNVTESPMVPFVFFNFLNDGSGYLDETSFIEQAKHLQTNYNQRGQTIIENAKYGGTGVPIFAKDAIDSKDAAKVRFSPIQRVLLDSSDVSKAFTTWRAESLPQYIIEDKYDERNQIDNIWGTPNVMRGEQSDNNTLGQDVIIRNQAEGRLADPVDCIDDSMDRFYNLEAQMMYRYFDEKKFYNYKGNNGKFVSVVVSNEEIRKNLGIEISVQAGTSLPIDRAQKRATIMELAKLNRVSTLVMYKELGIFDDPEEAYKQHVLEQLDPESSVDEADRRVFNREAHQDLMVVIGGSKPNEREDIEDEYVQHLTDWLMTDKFKILREKKPEAAMRVSEFVDGIIEKAKRKADKMAMVAAAQPLPEQMPDEQQPQEPQEIQPAPQLQ